MSNICGQPMAVWISSWRRILGFPKTHSDVQVIAETRYYAEGIAEVLRGYDAEQAKAAGQSSASRP